MLAVFVVRYSDIQKPLISGQSDAVRIGQGGMIYPSNKIVSFPVTGSKTDNLPFSGSFKVVQ